MLASYPPFYDPEPLQTYRKILRGRMQFTKDFNKEVKDVIRGFLFSHSNLRLGMRKGSVHDIRKHEWFRDFDWEMLRSGSMVAPCFS